MLRDTVILSFVGVILWAAATETLAAEDDVAVTVREKWSNVFAGRRAEFHCTVAVKKPFQGRIGWSLAVGRRTIARDETLVIAGPRKAGTVTIQCDLPQVAEGVVMPAVLSVACYGPNGGPPAASLVKPLWIFHEDPFASRSQWLKKLRLHLFDPAGKTRDLLYKASIPFTETRNVDSLTALEAGILIIGEGTSLAEYRALPRIMMRTAAKGIPVLCLAPSKGQFAIPGAEDSDQPSPSRITFRRADVIRQFDKRLDDGAWSSDGKVAIAGLVLKSDQSRVIAEAVSADAGWSWFEAHFGEARGKLIVCGFGLVRKWDAGPTPRFFLVRLLEYINADATQSTDRNSTSVADVEYSR
jgi:hypothetical protein